MSIFSKRQDPTKQACGATAPAPGVVPPPAAPTYSMRPPQGAASAVQERIQEKVRIAVQRSRTSVSPADVGGRTVRQTTPATVRTATIDLLAQTQAGLLNLARTWLQAEAPIRAIHTYVALLTRYPDSPAAAEAVADLVELSERFIGEGQFHAASGIYEYLEDLA